MRFENTLEGAYIGCRFEFLPKCLYQIVQNRKQSFSFDEFKKLEVGGIDEVVGMLFATNGLVEDGVKEFILYEILGVHVVIEADARSKVAKSREL